MGDSDQTAGTTFSLVRYNNPVVIDKEETIVRPKSAPASTGEQIPQLTIYSYDNSNSPNHKGQYYLSFWLKVLYLKYKV